MSDLPGAEWNQRDQHGRRDAGVNVPEAPEQQEGTGGGGDQRLQHRKGRVKGHRCGNRQAGHAGHRCRFLDAESIQPKPLHQHLRHREECERGKSRQVHRGALAEIQGDHEQSGQRIDDHVAEHEQRDAQENVGAAQIHLQVGQHPVLLFRNQQSRLGPVIDQALHPNRPLIVPRIQAHSSRPNLRASTTSAITTMEPVTTK